VKKDGTPLSDTYLAIQAETTPAEFRKIEIIFAISILRICGLYELRDRFSATRRRSAAFLVRVTIAET
jgi:hypothetical protein